MSAHIRIRYAKKDFTVGLGDGPIQPTDGFGGYGVVDRSRDDGITLWNGQGPPAYLFPILLDGYPDRGIQHEYDRFMALGRSPDGDEPPPVFRVTGPFDGSGKRYVMEGTPDFGQTIREDGTYRLLRQALTVTFRQYVAPDQVKIKRRSSGSSGVPWGFEGRTYTTRQGDTLVAVASRLRPQDSGKDQLRYARAIGDLNGVRDVRKRLDAGTVLRLPGKWS